MLTTAKQIAQKITNIRKSCDVYVEHQNTAFYIVDAEDTGANVVLTVLDDNSDSLELTVPYDTEIVLEA